MFRSNGFNAVATNEKGDARFVPIGGKANPVAAQPSRDTAVLATHGPVADKLKVTRRGGRVVETADTVSPSVPSGGSTTVSSISTDSMYTDVLYEITATNNASIGDRKVNMTLSRIFRDIYYYDSIGGSAVDLFSSMPFSDFQLTGIKDEKMMAKYTESCERMSLAQLLPSISTEYMVLGTFIASLSWDEKNKIFNGIAPQNVDNCFFTPVPVYGMDPLINLRIDEQTKEYLSKATDANDPRAKRYLDMIPEDFKRNVEKFADAVKNTSKDQGGAQGIALDPDYTLFIGKRSLLTNYIGNSFFKRLLPAWFVEKALIRGTMDQVYKRQRAISHITIGNQDWVPTNAEMQAIADMFLAADLDPVGSVVITRDGVSVADVRRGDDFYKWTDAYDQLSTIKFRALGISETFVTGEANYSTMEQALSVIMEQIRTHRSVITDEVFYRKVFPAIAKANNITTKRYGAKEVASYDQIARVNERFTGYYDNSGMLYAEIANGGRPNLTDYVPSQYVTPKVVYNKRLMPEGDREYLELLTMMEEKGLPVTARMIASAGGTTIKQLMEGQEDDLRVREQFSKFLEKRKEFMPKPEDGGDEIASLMAPGMGGVRRRHILNREYAQEDIPDLDSRGKRRVQTGKYRKQKAEKLNKVMAEAAAANAQKENGRIKLERAAIEPTKKYYFRKGK